jgi:hypothetical protein
MEALEGLAMTSSSRVELRRAYRDGGVRNVALPTLSSLREEDEEVEGLKAERGMQFGRWWCSGERARARRSSAGNGGLVFLPPVRAQRRRGG